MSKKTPPGNNVYGKKCTTFSSAINVEQFYYFSVKEGVCRERIFVEYFAHAASLNSLPNSMRQVLLTLPLQTWNLKYLITR